MVLIGHASISETGSVNGLKGDSTGKEVCTRTWYSKPWDFMAIHPNATVREKHAKAIEAACANNNIGYGQADRNTANTEAKKVDYDISKIKTKCNTDCSALQNLAAVASDAPGVTYGSNGWTTYTMLEVLIDAGYIIIAKSVSISGYNSLNKSDKNKIIIGNEYLLSSDYCVRGAIYVNINSHTVCGLTNGSKSSQTLSKAGISSSTSTTSTTTKTTVSTTKTSTTSSTSKFKISSDIKSVQKWLNKYYKTGLVVDGIYGSKTKVALIKAWQTEVGGLTVDGIFGEKSKTKSSSHVIKKGASGILVTIWQAYLVCRGYNPNGIDGIFGNGCHTATIVFQKTSNLIQDGEVGKNTWSKAFV